MELYLEWKISRCTCIRQGWWFSVLGRKIRSQFRMIILSAIFSVVGFVSYRDSDSDSSVEEKKIVAESYLHQLIFYCIYFFLIFPAVPSGPYSRMETKKGSEWCTKKKTGVTNRLCCFESRAGKSISLNSISLAWKPTFTSVDTYLVEQNE